MQYKIKIDKNSEERVEATLHRRGEFAEKLEELVLSYEGDDKITAYTEDDVRILRFSEIEYVTVIDSKTYAIDFSGEKLMIKYRLYELAELLPEYFIKINKSSIANKRRIERFRAAFSGSVDVVFKSGCSDYVSRRCFAEIKKELKK